MGGTGDSVLPLPRGGCEDLSGSWLAWISWNSGGVDEISSLCRLWARWSRRIRTFPIQAAAVSRLCLIYSPPRSSFNASVDRSCSTFPRACGGETMGWFREERFVTSLVRLKPNLLRFRIRAWSRRFFSRHSKRKVQLLATSSSSSSQFIWHRNMRRSSGVSWLQASPSARGRSVYVSDKRVNDTKMILMMVKVLIDCYGVRSTGYLNFWYHR